MVEAESTPEDILYVEQPIDSCPVCRLTVFEDDYHNCKDGKKYLIQIKGTTWTCPKCKETYSKKPEVCACSEEYVGKEIAPKGRYAGPTVSYSGRGKNLSQEARDKLKLVKPRRLKWSLDEPCQAVELYGKHQFKRQNFPEAPKGKKRRYLCRCCGIDKSADKHTYLTALGILKEWIESDSRVSKYRTGLSDSYDPDIEAVSDLGRVYSLSSEDESSDSLTDSQRQAPTRYFDKISIPKSERHKAHPKRVFEQTARRFKRVLLYQEIERICKSREPLLEGLIDRIVEGCKKCPLQIEDFRYWINTVRRCLYECDFRVVEGLGMKNRATPSNLLSMRELEQTAAAAANYYIEELSQKEIAGSHESIFPHVKRTNMIDWRKWIIEPYDRRKMSKI